MPFDANRQPGINGSSFPLEHDKPAHIAIASHRNKIQMEGTIKYILMYRHLCNNLHSMCLNFNGDAIRFGIYDFDSQISTALSQT